MTKPTHTPNRVLRVSDDLWARAGARAAEDGETLSDAIRRFLERYARREDSWHTKFSPADIEELFARVRRAEAAYRRDRDGI